MNELKIMGILNVTPDSFFPGSRVENSTELFEQAENMILSGADILDVGGQSTRPGAELISLEEELKRVIPAIKSLRDKFPDILISVDTFRSEIARRAVEEGADMINDVFAGRMDENMFQTVADLKVPYILMHSRGVPKNMQSLTNYTNLVAEVMSELNEKLKVLREKGVSDVIIDPGFGFAKTMEQNYELLNSLDEFKALNCPILVGVSRKGMIYKKLGLNPAEALNGTSIVNTVAAMRGANILRVHDVREAKQIGILLDRII